MTQSTPAQTLNDRLKKLRLMVFDVDGVLTDGKLYLNDRGEEMKAFNTLDGLGLKVLQASGVEVAIITGRRSETVALRAKNLGVKHLFQGVENKKEAFVGLLSALNVAADAAGFMGDDWIDLAPMRMAGLAVAVPAAPAVVQASAHLVTQRGGGDGAVRELCEAIMITQGTFDQALASYLE